MWTVEKAMKTKMRPILTVSFGAILVMLMTAPLTGCGANPCEEGPQTTRFACDRSVQGSPSHGRPWDTPSD